MLFGLLACIAPLAASEVVAVSSSGATAELDRLNSLGAELAKKGAFEEAAKAFEAAAALPPASVLRFTKHRIHNLMLLGGQQTTPRTDALPPLVEVDGGWGGSSNVRDVTPSCDVDVRANLSAAEFASEYVLASRPVLLPLNEVAAAGDMWSRSRLLQAVGDCVVPVVATSSVVDEQQAGSAPSPARQLSTPAKLRDFLFEHLVECTDEGPWPCAEEGCPSDPLGCTELAQLEQCEHEFGEVWATPPRAHLASEQIFTRCPRSCGICAVLETPPAQHTAATSEMTTAATSAGSVHGGASERGDGARSDTGGGASGGRAGGPAVRRLHTPAPFRCAQRSAASAGSVLAVT